jgi:quercetin dioxygenase-like cupin family protein
MRNRHWGIPFLFLAAIGFAVVAIAQDAVKVSPDAFTVKTDNAKVRILEYHSKPGQKEGMHSHPANIVYVVAGGKIRYTSPDGKTQDVEMKTGDTMYREPTTHSVENIGKTNVKSILVELK